MDTPSTEQDLRREAIRRRLTGEPRCDICRDLNHSPRWFSKWWAVYQQNPRTDFADRSRVPLTSPAEIPESVVQAIVSIRKTLEAAATPATRYGLIGPRAIQGQLEDLDIDPPSIATIQRILQAQGLTHPIGAGNDSAYYPWLEAWAVNAIHATDIITRHIRGGEEIQNFHTIDHYSHAAYLSQHTDKTSATTNAHLLATWSKLGLPQIQQLDNEGAFCGGHTHPRVIGQVVRLCLRLRRAGLSRCSHRSMKRSATIRSSPSIVSGMPRSGRGKSFAIVCMCKPRSHSSNGGITRSIDHLRCRARRQIKCAAGYRLCVWIQPYGG